MLLDTSALRKLSETTFGGETVKMSEHQSLPASNEHTLSVTLTTTFALIDQFSTSITQSSNQSNLPAREHSPSSTHSPLPLLSASAASLKAQSTKLSLLTLTPPFTPSAVSTVLSALNSSVLPSLLTAALLVTNEENKYTVSFSAEVRSLVRATLRDLHTLVSCVERRSKFGDPKDQLDEEQKSNVTEAVGRVWESCDELIALADGDIGAFIVKKAEMWLGLIKDAVEELGEWDPEEDGVDGLFGEDAQKDDNAGKETEEDSAAAERAKACAMKVLTRVPQSLHVVVKQRLRKWNWNSTGSKDSSDGDANYIGWSASPDDADYQRRDQGTTVDHVLRGMQHVSETVDEMAEALYMGELNRSGRLVKEVWKATLEVVEIVKSPMQGHAKRGNGDGVAGGHTETNEDKYIRRALDWIKLVEPKSPSARAVTNGSTQGITDG
jgi:hypothetical protein